MLPGALHDVHAFTFSRGELPDKMTVAPFPGSFASTRDG